MAEIGKVCCLSEIVETELCHYSYLPQHVKFPHINLIRKVVIRGERHTVGQGPQLTNTQENQFDCLLISY